MPEGQDSDLLRHRRDPARRSRTRRTSEAFRAKGYEVLLLTDQVDEVWVDAVPTFEDKPFASIARGDVDLGGDDVDAETKEGFEDLTAWMTTTLSEDVKQVRLSHRLTTSAAVLVGDPGDLTPTLEKMYRAMGQPLPKVKRTLELNPKHGLVARPEGRARRAPRSGSGRHRTPALRHGAAGRGRGAGGTRRVRVPAVQAAGEHAGVISRRQVNAAA